MSDTPTPPEPGQTLWGDDLNAYLLSLEGRIASNEDRFDVQAAQLSEMQIQINAQDTLMASLEDRITALESRPDYVYDNAAYQFSNAAPPATGNQIRLNNIDPTLATTIDIRRVDSDGADRSQWMMMLTDLALLRIQDWDNSNVWHRYGVLAPPTLDATNAQIPVVWHSGEGLFPNAKVNVAFTVALPIWVYTHPSTL